MELYTLCTPSFYAGKLKRDRLKENSYYDEEKYNEDFTSILNKNNPMNSMYQMNATDRFVNN